jgi:deoxyribose-phosphate aldolase
MQPIDPKVLDFANHRADASQEDIKTLCNTVLQYGFNSAFVNPIHVKLAHDLLGGKAKVGTVISFPLGQDIPDVKVHAIREAVQAGADELDIVPDISKIKEDKLELFQGELKVLTYEAKSMRKDVIVKFIIETGLFVPEHFLSLNTPEITMDRKHIVDATRAIERSGADFVKICSGMGRRGVSVDDVTLVRSIVSPTMRVKGAGGIDTKEKALALLSAGANRLGTSHAVEILTELNKS